MACLFYTQLFLMTTFTLALNQKLDPERDQIVGDIEETSMDEEGAQQALNSAIIQYNEKSCDLYLSRVVKVISVQKQISSGKTFFFNVLLAKTKCMKNKTDLTNCPINKQPDQQETEFCIFEVHLPSCINYPIVLDTLCDEYTVFFDE